jgi:hypothetical protein
MIINKNIKNLGIGPHVSKIIHDLANGEYCILIGGDDISKKNHAEKAVSYIEGKFKDFNMLDFNANIIDNKGKFVRKIEIDYDYKKFGLNDFIIANNIKSFAPGRIIKKSFFKSFDPISNNCPTEDVIIVLRSLLTGGFIRLNEILVSYRRHDENVSNQKGLAKFSNFAIIAQFTSDIIQAFNKNLINEKQAKLLIKRTSFELTLRNIKFSKKWYNRNKYISIALVIIAKYIYKIKNFFK